MGSAATSRVLAVWVYDRTRSLLVAMLMHASLTGSVLYILMPRSIRAESLSIWYLLFGAGLWVLVVAVALTDNGECAKASKDRTFPG